MGQRPREVEVHRRQHPQEVPVRVFRNAIVFVNRVATIADEQKHHPEITVRYDQVWLKLWSHDAGGVTERDLKLAERIDFATSAR